jgi:hypothetical protein
MTELMTRSDRDTLVKIARQRERLAKTEAKERAAQLTAEFEQQLTRRYHYDDNETWAAATKAARAAIDEAQAKVQEECDRLGIPREFTPSLGMGWAERGRNDSVKERADMRRVAHAQIELMTRQACTAIERRSLETQEKIMVGGLSSDDARLFLEAMPTAEALMPALEIGKVETLMLTEGAKQ